MEKYIPFGEIVMDTIRAATKIPYELRESSTQEDFDALVEELFISAMDRIKAELDKKTEKRW